MKVKVKSPKKRTFGIPFYAKRVCRFCKDNIRYIDYKDIKTLERYVSERGKIISRRLSGNCAKHQRLIAETIKKARFIALLPYAKV